MNIGRIVAWNRFGLRLGKLQDALEKEEKMGFDWKITAWKGAKALGLGILAVAGAAGFAYLSDATATTEALKHAGVSDLIVVALVPILKAAGTMGVNWLQHRD